MKRVFAGLLPLVVALVGCTRLPTSHAPDQTTSTAELGSCEARLLEISGSYESYGRLDSTARWAPAFCRATPPSQLALSRSTDDGTHGRKLYSVFAKEAGAYALMGEASPVGQVVVKESWVPEKVKDDGKPLEPIRRKVKVRQGETFVEQEDSFLPYARKDGHLYHAKEQGPLFVMFKLDPKTPGTDEGWVYGTVTADGKTVNAVGKIESCMKCHQDAPHDRLFGLPEKQ